MFNWTEIKVT